MLGYNILDAVKQLATVIGPHSRSPSLSIALSRVFECDHASRVLYCAWLAILILNFKSVVKMLSLAQSSNIVPVFEFF